MQGLLGLLWLAPKEPNFVDRLFGRYADPEATYANQLDIALWMTGLFVLALIWRGIRRREFAIEPGGPRKTLLQMIAPELETSLAKAEFQTWANRLVTGALLVVALLASVNYFYGERNNGVYLHRWDAFHTVIGVKYFEELGYTDLYKCSYAIDREGPHHFRAVKEIRDLADIHKFVDRDEHIKGNDCKERFTPERLEQFRHDLNEFGTWSSKSQWKILMKDKGFNGTPFYATVCKLLVTPVDVTLESLRRLAYIDPILMMIAFGVVGWAFGARTAALVAILFCVFFPNRFEHMGGSILRFDYVATLLIGFSALKKDKWGLAGAMFAWATMVRVFPAIFAVGVGLKIASDVFVDRKLALRPEHLKFLGWFGGMLLLFFLISLVGLHGGFDNWRQWAADMKVHNSRSATYRIGFKHLFMLDGKLTSTDYNLKQKNFFAHQNYYWAAAGILIAPLLLSVRRLDTISFAALFGVFGFFLFAIATRYYYGVVALLLLVDRDTLSNRFMLILGAILFAATGFDYFYFELNDSDPLMYNIIIALEMTLVIVLVGSWLLWNPSLLDTPEMGEDPRIPTHVPAQLGARAEPVAPAPAKGKKKSSKKAASATAPEAEIETMTDATPLSTESAERLLAALGNEQATPIYDPHAVTVSEIELPPELAARYGQSDDKGDKPKRS
jgi:hypothetical protein